jgi:hypothetical protein
MRTKVLFLLVLGVLLLVACSSGPSNKEAADAFFQRSLLEVKIVGKHECEVPPDLVEAGYAEMWRVEYERVDNDDPGDFFLYKEGEEWFVFPGYVPDCE